MDENEQGNGLVRGREAVAAGRPKRRARPWHRVIGLLSALPLLWVVVTGALLNHTVDWKLDERMVDHPWVMRAYGMSPRGEPRVVDAAGHRVAVWDGMVFLDGELLDLPGELVGAVADGDGLAVVSSSHVLRLNGNSEQIELLDSASLPGVPLTGVRRQGNRIDLRDGSGWHEVVDDWLDFRDAADGEAQTLEPLPDGAERQALYQAWSQGGLPLSRILLDLHAGKFLGAMGRYFYDLVALATIILCITGGVLFFRKPRRNR